ncbi:MAG: ATP-dependent Clp protease adaptor ClpS [Phycisphaerales bacterium]
MSQSADNQGHQARGSAAVKESPAPPRLDRLPSYRVLLHNDDVNNMLEVVDAILELTTLKRTRAFEIMMTAHTQGVSLILLTHKERAELYRDQFHSKRLTVTIEPND